MVLTTENKISTTQKSIFSMRDASCNLSSVGFIIIPLIAKIDAGKQPMSDTEGRYWLIFNGEVYNYLEIRPQIEQEFNFRTRTEHMDQLLALLERECHSALQSVSSKSKV